ncbi:MAG: ATP synthase F0 subunit B [Pseudomonadota bacterium]
MIELIPSEILIQFILYFIVYIVISRLVFKPILRIIDSRRKLIDGNLAKAKELESKIDEKITLYETQITKARKEAVSRKSTIAQEGYSIQSEKINKAKEEAKKEILEFNNKLELEINKASEEIQKEAIMVAEMLENKLNV